MPNHGDKKTKTSADTSVSCGAPSGVSRRSALGLVGSLGLASVLSSPAIAQGTGITFEWKMVTSWQKDLPGPGVSAQRICDTIHALSGGRMNVRLYAAGELVPAYGVLDAVSSGTAQMGHSASFFWQGKMPASVFFTTVPGGFIPSEHVAWIEQGEGQALWDKLYEPFGVKAVMGGNTGACMAGWFTRDIASLDDLKGLKMRVPGLGGEVMRRLGATPVNLAPGELYAALQSGLIDATEFLGPWSDRAMGFYRVTKRYCVSPFFKPNGSSEALFNNTALEGLPEDLRAVVLAACQIENARGLAESDWMNALNLREMADKDGVELVTYPADVLNAFRSTSAAVLTDLAKSDEMAGKIYASYQKAMEPLAGWTEASQRRFLHTRDGML